MFDRNVLVQSTDTLRVSATITEKRAPTDESVRLLREMESKAEAEVIKAVAVRDNAFSGVIHSKYDVMSAAHTLRMVYSINGKKLTTDCTIDDWDTSPDAWVPKFIDAVARDVALEILQRPLTDALRKSEPLFRG